MDSASKAVIIAAGVFIGMLVISISMYMFAAYRDVYEQSMIQFESQQIASFNSFFTQYPPIIKGYDVYNIIGKINEINASNDIDYFISFANNITKEKDFYFTEAFKFDYNYSYSYDSEGVISKIEITPVS